MSRRLSNNIELCDNDLAGRDFETEVVFFSTRNKVVMDGDHGLTSRRRSKKETTSFSAKIVDDVNRQSINTATADQQEEIDASLQVLFGFVLARRRRAAADQQRNSVRETNVSLVPR